MELTLTTLLHIFFLCIIVALLWALVSNSGPCKYCEQINKFACDLHRSTNSFLRAMYRRAYRSGRKYKLISFLISLFKHVRCIIQTCVFYYITQGFFDMGPPETWPDSKKEDYLLDLAGVCAMLLLLAIISIITYLYS